jgi:hypothetical protein
LICRANAFVLSSSTKINHLKLKKMIDSGVYKLGNGLLYYVIVEGNTIRWLGERSDGHWCHIYEGQFSSDGTTFEGSYVDVPKGVTNTIKSEKYNVISRTRFENVRSLGYFYEKQDEWPEIYNIRNSLMHKASFQGSTLSDLTGTWLSDNGGVYYLRQLRDGRVLWVGEPERRNMDEPLPWSNVFFGNVETDPNRGKFIRGSFYDTPKGKTRGSGRVEFELNGDNSEFIKLGNGAGSGRKWRKVYSVVVKMKCSGLNIIRQNERKGDEPMITMAFFNADSSSVDWDNPAAAQIHVVSHFTGGLGSNAKQGAYLRPQEHQSSACFHVAYHPKNNVENEIAKLGVVFNVIEDDQFGSLQSGTRFPWRRVPSVRWGRTISTEQELPEKRYYSPGKVPPPLTPPEGAASIPYRPIPERQVQIHDHRSLGAWMARSFEHAIRNEEELPPLRYGAPTPTKDDYIGTNGFMWEIGRTNGPILPAESIRGQRLGVSGDDAQYWVYMQLSVLDDRVVCPDPIVPQSGGLSGGA